MGSPTGLCRQRRSIHSLALIVSGVISVFRAHRFVPLTPQMFPEADGLAHRHVGERLWIQRHGDRPYRPYTLTLRRRQQKMGVIVTFVRFRRQGPIRRLELYGQGDGSGRDRIGPLLRMNAARLRRYLHGISVHVTRPPDGDPTASTTVATALDRRH